MSQIIDNFAQISDNYDAAFVDLWGCMHNGLVAYQAAVKAMQDYRARGGKVVFVTNAPRPRAAVAAGFAQWGIPDDAFDTIATSGDAARMAMYEGVVGDKVYFMGDAGDHSFFVPPRIMDAPRDITRVDFDAAEGIVCLGPFDTHADPEVNRPLFEKAIARGMKLLCANPDIIVDRGETREWCAGALAKLYTEMGGESLYFGKPHGPIYDLARKRLAALGTDPATARIICIGDGIKTDILGAEDEKLDSLFITGGLAAAETKTATQPDPQALADYLAAQGNAPTYSIGFLR